MVRGAFPPGLRPGLYSCAASRLASDSLPFDRNQFRNAILLDDYSQQFGTAGTFNFYLRQPLHDRIGLV
jgi:hypothetical protein